MTLEELNCKFLKAHILMGVGAFIGNMAAEMYHLKYQLLVALLTGLLASIRIYRQCAAVMIIEYKRLKAKEKNEE